LEVFFLLPLSLTIIFLTSLPLLSWVLHTTY
jgi:hypothetical protein